MPDLTLIGAALSSIKAATDIAKIIRESTTSLEKAEVNYKLAELVGALAEAKLQIAEIQELILEKDRSIKALQDELNTRVEVRWEKPYYWREREGNKDGPFCQQCYDNTTKLIRLQSVGTGHWECATCHTYYFDSDFRESGGCAETDFDPYA